MKLLFIYVFVIYSLLLLLLWRLLLLLLSVTFIIFIGVNILGWWVRFYSWILLLYLTVYYFCCGYLLGRWVPFYSWILLLYLTIYSWTLPFSPVRSCGTPFSWSLTTIWWDDSTRLNWQGKVLFCFSFHFRPDFYCLYFIFLFSC